MLTYFHQSSYIFLNKNISEIDIILHFCNSLLISGLIKTAEFSLLLYSICCDILILIKNIKKIWSHTEM